MTATPSIKVWVIMMAIILFITIPATTIGKGCQLCTGICGRTGWSVSANFPLFCRQLQPQSEILLSLSDVCAHFRMRKGQRGSMLLKRAGFPLVRFRTPMQCNALRWRCLYKWTIPADFLLLKSACCFTSYFFLI